MLLIIPVIYKIKIKISSTLDRIYRTVVCVCVYRARYLLLFAAHLSYVLVARVLLLRGAGTCACVCIWVESAATTTTTHETGSGP